MASPLRHPTASIVNSERIYLLNDLLSKGKTMIAQRRDIATITMTATVALMYAEEREIK